MLIHGNCLEEMKNIPDNSTKLVLTSPPYNMNLRIRNGKYCSRQIVKEISTKYNNFDDNMPMDEYFEFNKKIILECLRISEITFYNVQFITGNKTALFKLIGEFLEQLKEVIIWDKVNAQPAMRDNVLNSQYETILVFDKKDAISRRFKSCNFKRGTLSNVWKIKREKKKYNHGATFPIELATTVIENFTDKNDFILDPFMGTGTTGLACKMLNRNFIGIEIDKEYFDISKKRIEEYNQLKIDFD